MQPQDPQAAPPSEPHELRRRALAQLIRPTRAEGDLQALARNLAEVKRVAGSSGVLAVVKANAYGHGAAIVARALERLGVELLGVALVEEALELRNAGVRAPILVLGGAYEGGWDLIVANGLIPTIFRIDHLEHLAEAARRANKGQVAAHVKIDTGMGRLGLLEHEIAPFLDRAAQLPEVRIEGLLSHFANADLADAALTSLQVRRFKDALALMRARGLEPRYRHLANSAGVMDHPEVRDGLELNLVRPGIMLYGYSPAGWLGRDVALTPVLSWKSAVTHLKTVPAGTPVSYGSTWTAQRESVIATVPLGYADGYGREYSGTADVLIRGRRAKIAGRVCMDMFMVDVTDVPGVALGDEVVLLGAQGAERIDASELAAIGRTIHYEVLCAVGSRVPRRAVNAAPRGA